MVDAADPRARAAADQTRPAPARIRRVPAELRKRSALSCDSCRSRRRKCIRRTKEESCQRCAAVGQPCTSTPPRKAHLSETRLQLVEDLLVRLFPDVDLTDLSQLKRLSDATKSGEVRIFYGEDDAQELPSEDVGDSESEGGQDPNASLSGASKFSLVERMLLNSSGTISYFGPSSSMAFVAKLREFLKPRTDSPTHSLNTRGTSLHEHFAADRSSFTMETDAANRLLSPGSSAIPTAVVAQSGASLAAPNPVDSDTGDIQSLRAILPCKGEVEELIELYFDKVHPNNTLFHRPTFQETFEDFWSNDRGIHHRRDNTGWTVCLCVALAFGCDIRLSSRTNNITPRAEATYELLVYLQQQLLVRALEKMPQLVLGATLENVQALTLLSTYLNCVNERNVSWVMVGCAMRLAISLGLHRESGVVRDVRLSLTEREMRKNVWWTLYIFEQYMSGLFGRPTAISEEEIASEMPAEAIIQYAYQPPGLMAQHVQLARILNSVRLCQRNLRIINGEDHRGLPKISTVARLFEILNGWEVDLPSFLRIDITGHSSLGATLHPNHFRHLAALQLRYQQIRLILGRPFLLKTLQGPIGHQGKASVSEGPAKVSGTIHRSVAAFSDECIRAALTSSTLIRNLWRDGLFDGKFSFDGIFAYQCAMVLAFAYLDTTATGWRDRDLLRCTTQELLDIMHRAPLNKTMNRLVQITEDFAAIVFGKSTSAMNAAPSASQMNASNGGDSIHITRDSAPLSDSIPPAYTHTMQPRDPPTALHGGIMENMDEMDPMATLGNFWDLQSEDLVESLLNGDVRQLYSDWL